MILEFQFIHLWPMASPRTSSPWTTAPGLFPYPSYTSLDLLRFLVGVAINFRRFKRQPMGSWICKEDVAFDQAMTHRQ